MPSVETRTSENALLEVLRASRWEATGGEGNPPDLSYLRDDCLEEIAAEFFEGEAGSSHNGKTLVRYGSSRERVFFVSELFTEYDPPAKTWKTFHISRRGTDVLSIAACREDGSALDGYEQRTFHDLEERGVAHYTGTSSEARIQIVFQPTPLGEDVLYAFVSAAAPEIAQPELELGLPKLRRRGRRLLRPEPLDIPMLIKQGQHLTNQILGRPTVSAKPVILERLAAFKIPGEINEQLISSKIRVIGADLTSSQHQALGGILKLLTIHGYVDKSIRVFPDHWCEAYGAERYEHSKRGTPQFSPRVKLQAMQALASLAAQPMLISYKRRNENERWDVVQRITHLIKISSGYVNVPDKEADQLMSGIVFSAIDNLKVIEIACDDIFFDQIHQHYFRRPRELDERLRRAGGHRRLPDSVYNFINYLFSDGEMRRRKNAHNPDNDWRLVISLTDLAYLLRMASRIKHGERGRVIKEIDKIATLTVEIDLLKTYNLEDEEALVFELNAGVAFPAMDDRVNPQDAHNPFTLVSSVKAIRANPQRHSLVRSVLDKLVPGDLGENRQQQNSIARAIRTVASRLLNLQIIVPEENLRAFLFEVAAKVREREGIRAIDKYFSTALEERLLAALDRFSEQSNLLKRDATTNPKAAAKLAKAEAFLEALNSCEIIK
jgi:hypothetical protein